MGLPVGEDDVHGPEEQPVGQSPGAVHEPGKQRFPDAQALRQRAAPAGDFAGRLEELYRCRAHPSKTSAARFRI